MILQILSGIAFAAAGASSAPLHQTTVQHGDTPVTAVYKAEWTTSARQLGGHTPNRPNLLQSCQWKAEVVVNRAVSNASGQAVPALGKPVHRQTLTGAAPGTCAAAKSQMKAAIARAMAQGDARLAAEQDRDVLHGELQGLSALSPRRG
jgi:hypothetical protein